MASSEPLDDLSDGQRQLDALVHPPSGQSPFSYASEAERLASLRLNCQHPAAAPAEVT